MAAAKEKQRQEREAAKEEEAEKVHEESLAMLAKERALAKGAAKSGAAGDGSSSGGIAAGVHACRTPVPHCFKLPVSSRAGQKTTCADLSLRCRSAVLPAGVSAGELLWTNGGPVAGSTGPRASEGRGLFASLASAAADRAKRISTVGRGKKTAPLPAAPREPLLEGAVSVAPRAAAGSAEQVTASVTILHQHGLCATTFVSHGASARADVVKGSCMVACEVYICMSSA